MIHDEGAVNRIFGRAPGQFERRGPCVVLEGLLQPNPVGERFQSGMPMRHVHGGDAPLDARGVGSLLSGGDPPNKPFGTVARESL